MKSVKSYIDELIDSVQDFDNYVGTSNGKIDPIRMKRFKKAKKDLRNYIFKLKTQIKELKK